MPVDNISRGSQVPSVRPQQNKRKEISFSKLLEKEKGQLKASDGRSIPFKEPSTIEVGTISDKTPTVSHILKGSSTFQKSCWNIIFSDINQNKNYTKLSKGTKISINTATNEIIWSHKPNVSAHVPPVKIAQFLPEKSEEIKISPKQQSNPRNQITIGVLSKTNPTVSHLLKNSDVITGNFWNIIFDPINQNKPFNSLPRGTQVSLDTNTSEIIFNKIESIPYSQVHFLSQNKDYTQEKTYSQNNEDINFSSKFADSIKPFIGRPYEEIDCYGLVIRGLMKQGVHYQGPGGLKQSLEDAALFKGLPENAYLNGEGLIEKAGTTLYSKNYPAISDSFKQSSEIYSEIKERLKPGHILSFSTTSRGHTGVIAKRKDMWTYINSGRMDNTLQGSGKIDKKVGEEILEEEIKNWCQLAQKRDEPLSVTLGRFDEEKLKRFSKNSIKIDLSKI